MQIAIIEAANVEVPIAVIVKLTVVVVATVVVATVVENNDKKYLPIRLSSFIQTKSNKHSTYVCIHHN